jgi:hypothetical protein
MNLKLLRAFLGGEIVGGQLVCAGPGHSSRDRSLSVRLDPDAPDGFVVYSHAGDDFGDCRDYVRAHLGIPRWQPADKLDRCVRAEQLRAVDIPAANRESDRQPLNNGERNRMACAIRVWSEAGEPRNTLAEQYLHDHRSLDLPAELCGTVLRFHPRCPWRDLNAGNMIFTPALIAAFKSIDNAEVTGIHRIALNSDGSKRGRRMLGITRRATVRLDPARAGLVIGEGIETCLAAREFGFAPVWALGSIAPIAQFPVIDGVENLTILGETGTASADAIRSCAARWHAAGRRVRAVMPDHGSDLNDELARLKTRNQKRHENC